MAAQTQHERSALELDQNVFVSHVEAVRQELLAARSALQAQGEEAAEAHRRAAAELLRAEATAAAAAAQKAEADALRKAAGKDASAARAQADALLADAAARSDAARQLERQLAEQRAACDAMYKVWSTLPQLGFCSGWLLANALVHANWVG